MMAAGLTLEDDTMNSAVVGELRTIAPSTGTVFCKQSVC